MALQAWMLLTMASMAYAPAPFDNWEPWGNPRHWPPGTHREPWADRPGRNPRYDNRGYKSDQRRKEKRQALGLHQRYLEQQEQAAAAAHHAHVTQTQAALDRAALERADALAATYDQAQAIQAAANQAAVALMAQDVTATNPPGLAAATAAPAAPVIPEAHRDIGNRQAVAAEALTRKKQKPLSAAEGILASKRFRNGSVNPPASTGSAASISNATLKRQAPSTPQRQGKHRTASPPPPATHSKSASTTSSKLAKKSEDRVKPEELRSMSKTAPRTPAKAARSGTPARAHRPQSLPMHTRIGTKEAASPSLTSQHQVAAANQNKIQNGAPT